MNSTALPPDAAPEIRPRNRPAHTIALLIIIALGLASRRHGVHLPALLHKSAGDILWATAIFLLIGILRPLTPTRRVAAVTLAFSICDEFSQAYHVPWLDAIRSTPVGHLVLGSDFYWGDITCYILGVAIGLVIEQLLLSLRRPPHPRA